MKKNILHFYKYTKGYRKYFLLAISMTFISVGFYFLIPQVMCFVIDSVIGNEPFNLPNLFVQWIEQIGGRVWLQEHLILVACVALFFSVLSYLCDFTSRASIGKASESVVKVIRDSLFEHIQYLPYSWHAKNQTGDIIQRCTMDVELIYSFLSSQLQQLIKTVSLILVACIMMFQMNVTLTIVVLCFIPVTLTYSSIFYHLTGKKFEKADECEGELTAIVQENLTGVRVVRAFGRQAYEMDKFNEKHEEFTDLWVSLGNLLGLNWGFGDVVSLLQTLAVVLFGCYLAVNGSLSAGEFLTFVSYNSMLIWPTRNLGRILSDLSKTTISSTRLFEILDSPLEDSSATKDFHDGDIVFEQVSFAYENHLVIDDVSFEIKQGSSLGILGITGSGKSTLMYLLDHLYELEKGTISIDGINIIDIDLHQLRKNIGIVLQEPFLFSKSFEENIGDGSDENDIDKIRYFSKLACIDDTIVGFKEGYQTQIGERGVTISGGQKQRVAIARMLMQETPIKIFDDSLCAVDMETDAMIQKALKEHVKGTTIIIANRISTIMHCDTIIVMDKGKIVQIGNHQELIQLVGIYQTVYHTQKAVMKDEK
ncbi:ABC transporter ATP-binding protein [Tannockella kyphosi]|uniref:ABC transporter ATP-binding protein n=1 Tax=Tannockella kyphosi TaxID=2899121 RepID=UPI002012FBB3|nr:ABC transporter ATP-binding protein [Tannockella kyphosi]